MRNQIALLLVALCLCELTNGGFFKQRHADHENEDETTTEIPKEFKEMETRTLNPVPTHVQCRYKSHISVLSCATQANIAECQAIFNSEELGPNFSFNYFGIGSDKTIITNDTEFVRYRLHPRKLDNSGWWANSVVLPDSSICFSLFHSNTYRCSGFLIPELKCFEKLVMLFDVIETNEIIEIEDADGTFRNATLFGEIMVINKPEFV